MDRTKKWIIIEDRAYKAKEIIFQLLKKGKKDQIIWLFPNNKDTMPNFLREEDATQHLYQFYKEYETIDNNWEEIDGEIHFFWCHNEEDFITYFDRVNDHNGILLLDIQLPTLGNLQELDGILLEKVQHFLLDGPPGKSQGLICIISSVVSHGAAKGRISMGDERIISSGEWSFSAASLEKDCQQVIEECERVWLKLYDRPLYTLDQFLKKMSKLDQYQCHNWANDNPISLIKYKKNRLWNDTWDMPIQLGYLIKFLHYDHKEFVKEFDLRDKKYFNGGSAIAECLKIMGTNDERTDSISLLAATFFCWAAYRHSFPAQERKGDVLFIGAIKNCLTNVSIARYKLITPPQKLPTLKKTIQALYEMMTMLYKSTILKEHRADLLKDVKLNEKGLQIQIKINPEALFSKLSPHYSCILLSKEGPHKGKGGDTSQKVFTFWSYSNYCDKFVQSKLPILGSQYPFSILSAGDYTNNGLLIQFGYDT
ncbi:MAG: hypothetical protein MI974_14040 [Chitinophagales bacterium]|nr:hypothetical protein [Chitinophagales bacterium]